MKSRRKKNAYALMFAGVVLLGISGLVASASVIGDWRKVRAIERAPRSMSLAELIANGPGDNSHVLLTDFEFGEHGFRDGAVRRVPLFPKRAPDQEDGVAAAPRSFRVLLSSTAALNTPEDFAIMRRRDSIRGLVITPESRPFGGPEMNIGVSEMFLRTHYPDTDFSKCLVVEQLTSESWLSHLRDAYAETAMDAACCLGGLIALTIGCAKWARLRRRDSQAKPAAQAGGAIDTPGP